MIFSKEIEDLRNYARLNARNLSELYDLYIDIQKKIFGLDVVITDWKKFSFGNVTNSHNCPINGVTNWGNDDKTKPSSYLGWAGYNLKGNYKGKLKLIDKTILKEFSFERFDSIHFHSFQYGINTGSFNGGENFMGCFYLYLDDFPLILENLPIIISKKEFESAFPNKSYDRLLRKLKLEKILSE